MESISIFDNFDFMRKYEEKFENFIKDEFMPNLKKLKKNTTEDKILSESLKLIDNFYTSQLDFFQELCTLDSFFEKYKMKLKQLFLKIVKFELIEFIDYNFHFKSYMEKIFENLQN